MQVVQNNFVGGLYRSAGPWMGDSCESGLVTIILEVVSTFASVELLTIIEHHGPRYAKPYNNVALDGPLDFISCDGGYGLDLYPFGEVVYCHQ